MTSDQINWRSQCIVLLAAQPTNWLRLSELFAEVEPHIPVHIAMRRQTAYKLNTEVGVHTARWRLFLSHIYSLVERRPCEGATPTHRAARTDFVRLLPYSEPCADCGGPRFLLEWPQPGRFRRYTCPICAVVPEVSEPIVVEWVELPEPAIAAVAAVAEVKFSIPKRKKLRPNAYQRRGMRRRIRSNINPIQPVQSTWAKPKPTPPVNVTPVPPPQVPKQVVDSKKPVSVSLGLDPPILFTNCRTLAQHIKWFLGWGTINQIEQELLSTHSVSAILSKRGRTLREFVARINLNLILNKAKGH